MRLRSSPEGKGRKRLDPRERQKSSLLVHVSLKSSALNHRLLKVTSEENSLSLPSSLSQLLTLFYEVRIHCRILIFHAILLVDMTGHPWDSSEELRLSLNHPSCFLHFATLGLFPVKDKITVHSS